MKNLYLRNRMCFTVNGYNRAIVYDLNRTNYFFIPTLLHKKIVEDDIISFENSEYFHWEQFMLEKEIIFQIDTFEDKSLFPSISTKFEIPNLLTCLILHDNIEHNLLDNLQSLHFLNVSVIVEKYNRLKLLIFLQKLADLEIDSIYLYLTEINKVYSIDEFKDLNSIHQLFNVYVFGNSTLKEKKTDEKKIYDPINTVSLRHTFDNFSSSMLVEKMQVNYKHFFEAYNHHNYFNQKVYIDKEGNIKNGLNNKESFGNIISIGKEEFLKIIESKEFQKLWNINKQDTLICKDCEFRYMCVDPRVPKVNKNGQWYHTVECNYNPYISKWDNEAGYKTLSESGVSISKRGEMSIDKKILENAFESAWS